MPSVYLANNCLSFKRTTRLKKKEIFNGIHSCKELKFKIQFRSFEDTKKYRHN